MNRIDPKLAATLRQPVELVERGLAKVTDLADLERVVARYAIAVTPDTAIHSERAGIGGSARRKC